MGITVKGSGAFAELIPENCVLDDVETVADIARYVKWPSDTGVVILVNDHLAGWSTALEPGDIVHLIPAVGGG